MCLKLVVIGAGYVGGPSSVIFANMCPSCRVTVCDINDEVVQAWEAGTPLVHEPGLLSELGKAQARGNLHFTTDLDNPVKNADVIFMCVDTPTKRFGEGNGFAADISNLEAAVRSAARALQGTSGKIMVIKSTVPVGTGNVAQCILRHHKADVDVVSNPEFLAEGTAVMDMKFPSRVVIGSDEPRAIEKLVALYRNWVPSDRIVCTDLRSSELCKLVSNTLLAQRVSTMNAISRLCECVCADVDLVKTAVGMDPRIGLHFLQAGPGFGGSCFEKDIMNLAYIMKKNHLHDQSEFIKSIVHINNCSKESVFRRVLDTLHGTLRNKTIAVLGFAFKKNTNDARATPAATIVRRMLEEGARVRIYDPEVSQDTMEHEIRLDSKNASHTVFDMSTFQKAESAKDACDGARAIVLLTNWDEFEQLDFDELARVADGTVSLIDATGQICRKNKPSPALYHDIYVLGRSEIASQSCFSKY